MTYVDVMKVLISLVPETTEEEETNNSKIKIRRATQEDMNKMRG